MELRIANLFALQTGSRNFTGHKKTLVQIFMMSYGLMKLRCKLKRTDDFVVANVDKNQDINLAQNTRIKYTCGLALVGVELQKLAYSMELWTLNITVIFWMIIWYLSFNTFIRNTTDSCRIMIPNIHLSVLKNGLQEKR